MELPKCGYHTIHYKFHPSGIPYIAHSRDDGGAPIQLKTAQGEAITIEEKNIYTPRKNLGHYKSPSGNYKIQAAKILEKATKISQATAKCSITRPEAQMLYQSV